MNNITNQITAAMNHPTSFNNEGGAGASAITNHSFVPNVIQTTTKGDRSFDIYSCLLSNRIIVLNGPVTTESANNVVAQMLYLEQQNKSQDIQLYISSPGGDVLAGLAVYDTMKTVACDVSTTVTSAASMGSFLAMAGTPGKRYVTKSSRTMVHRVSYGLAGAQGTLYQVKEARGDIEATFQEGEYINDYLTQCYVDNNTAGMTFDQMQKIMRHDKWLSAEQAIQLGLADHVVQSRKVVK